MTLFQQASTLPPFWNGLDRQESIPERGQTERLVRKRSPDVERAVRQTSSSKQAFCPRSGMVSKLRTFTS